MRRAVAVTAAAICLAMSAAWVAAAGGTSPDWKAELERAASARDRRPVAIVLVSRTTRWQNTKAFEPAGMLRDADLRERVRAPGMLGYAEIPPRPRAAVAFVNTDRVPARLVRLVAAHEIGHILLHGRGFFETQTRDPNLYDAISGAQNVVQDVLLEGEMKTLGVDSQPLLTWQLSTLARSLEVAGPFTSLSRSDLATLATRLLLTVRGAEDQKRRIRALLPAGVAALVRKYTAILARPVTTPAQYREAVIAACEANGVRRSQVSFAPD